MIIDNTDENSSIKPVIDKKQKRPRKKHRMHPNSLKNLVPRPFKPGNCANPNGPPKARSFMRGHVCRFLNMKQSELERIDRKTLNMSQLIALKHVLKTFKECDFARVREEFDRDEGRSTEHVEVDSEQRIIVERI